MTILFDLDGTLIDSTEAILYSFDYSFSKFGIKSPKDELITPLIGVPLPQMFQKLGISDDLVDDMVKSYKECYQKIHTQKTKLLPDSKEALQIAKDIDATMAVVTSKTGKYSIELLEYFGIMKYFDTVVGSEDVTYHKPHPQPINTALKRLNKNTKDCYMIGDTCIDMSAAKNAKVKGLALLCGYGDNDSLNRCSNNVFQSVKDAVTYIVNS